MTCISFTPSELIQNNVSNVASWFGLFHTKMLGVGLIESTLQTTITIGDSFISGQSLVYCNFATLLVSCVKSTDIFWWSL